MIAWQDEIIRFFVDRIRAMGANVFAPSCSRRSGRAAMGRICSDLAVKGSYLLYLILGTAGCP